MSSIKNEKAEQFIQRLMVNPALKDLHPLKKEQQIISFLKVNEAQLYPTLSSPAFFPGQDRDKIREILVSSLRTITNSVILPPLNHFFSTTMKSGALISATKDPALNIKGVREGLIAFMNLILESSDGRESLVPALTVFSSPILDKYISQIIGRQKYISFEIRMVQRFKEIPENVVDYIKMTMLLKPVIHVFLENTGELVNGCISHSYAKRLIYQLQKKYPILPHEILKSIVFSNMSFQEDRDIDATSRLAAIFTKRALNWNPAMKVDRGAESSDKSWFNIARKNYRFYGYDMDMLMELYNIAAELGW
jgi:hypothetical protein